MPNEQCVLDPASADMRINTLTTVPYDHYSSTERFSFESWS